MVWLAGILKSQEGKNQISDQKQSVYQKKFVSLNVDIPIFKLINNALCYVLI